MYLCKHAIGTSRDMIEQGIRDGFKVFGISDHIAYPTKGTSYRMEYEYKEGYLADLKKLKEEFSQITVLRGFEAEYQRKLLYQWVEMFEKDEIDYLILGQHYKDIDDESTYYGYRDDTDEIVSYVDQCIEAMRTGLILFVAHPDLYLNGISFFDDLCYRESKRLIEATIKYDVFLEYNAGGVRSSIGSELSQKEYRYPNYNFWQIVKELGAKVVVSSDAHSPRQINDYYYQLACQQVYDLELNVLEEIDLEAYSNRVKQFVEQYNDICRNGQ